MEKSNKLKNSIDDYDDGGGDCDNARINRFVLKTFKLYLAKAFCLVSQFYVRYLLLKY